MFESIRKHSKLVMILLFLLIIPSFVVVGVNQNYFTESSQTVARVDGHDITQQDWDNAHRAESDRLRMQNPTMDVRLLDSEQARYATLEKLVRDRVLISAVQKLHLNTSDAELVRTLQEIPAIAGLRKPDGSLDAEAYKALVGAQGLTPEGFEANLRHDLALSKVLGSLAESGFATDAELKQAMDALYQRREVQLARFDAAAFESKVQVNEADLKAYYEANTALFNQPEEAAVEYVQLDLAAVAAEITLNEDDLRTYYQENAKRLAGPEERRASHILINAPADASAADRAQAKAKAEALLAQLRQDSKSFAAVAEKESQDPGSAPNGGDLGYFGPGAMVKPFEDAAFKLQEGEISDVVESDFGYHIIQVTGIKAPKVPSFEEMRPKLEADLRQQQAQRKFAEIAEAFSNGVYEQSESLQPVADKLKLTIHKAEHVTRQPAPNAQGPLANARFLEALFSADSLEHKRNTDAVELAPSSLVAGRVTQYSPARTLTMEELGDRLKQLYIQKKAAELAEQEGKAKLEQWRANPEGASLGATMEVGRDQAKDLPPRVLEAAMRAPAQNLPAWEGVSLGLEGYAVVKVNRIAPRPEADAQTLAQQRAQFTQWVTMAEAMAYYEQLKKQFKVQIKVPRP